LSLDWRAALDFVAARAKRFSRRAQRETRGHRVGIVDRAQVGDLGRARVPRNHGQIRKSTGA
jgi:hypothetical protein